MQAEELRSKYACITEDQAREGWTELYNTAAVCCMHGINCALGPDCQVCSAVQLPSLVDMAPLERS